MNKLRIKNNYMYEAHIYDMISVIYHIVILFILTFFQVIDKVICIRVEQIVIIQLPKVLNVLQRICLKCIVNILVIALIMM